MDCPGSRTTERSNTYSMIPSTVRWPMLDTVPRYMIPYSAFLPAKSFAKDEKRGLALNVCPAQVACSAAADLRAHCFSGFCRQRLTQHVVTVAVCKQ